jgi:hypothetical protein
MELVISKSDNPVGLARSLLLFIQKFLSPTIQGFCVLVNTVRIKVVWFTLNYMQIIFIYTKSKCFILLS